MIDKSITDPLEDTIREMIHGLEFELQVTDTLHIQNVRLEKHEWIFSVLFEDTYQRLESITGELRELLITKGLQAIVEEYHKLIKERKEALEVGRMILEAFKEHFAKHEKDS